MNQKNGLRKKEQEKGHLGELTKCGGQGEDGKEKVDIKEMRMKAYVLMRHLL